MRTEDEQQSDYLGNNPFFGNMLKPLQSFGDELVYPADDDLLCEFEFVSARTKRKLTRQRVQGNPCSRFMRRIRPARVECKGGL